MKHSAERILTTHVGSLPRPDDLMAMMQAKAEGKSVDETAYAATLQRAVADSVRQQAEVGLDVVSDGEMGKSSFITYVSERLGGMERRPGERPSPFAASRETASFPEFYQAGQAAQVSAVRRRIRIVCASPVSYQGHEALRAELANLKHAMAGQPVAEAFVPAIAPSNVETTYPERALPDRRGLSVRPRRRHARGIQGDRRRRLPAADRRSVPGDLLHHAAGPEPRGVPQVVRAAGRGAQSRARRDSAGQSPLPHLLQHQYGSARARHAA